MEPLRTTSQARGQPSTGGIADNGAKSRRTIKLTQKALHNAIDNKRKEFRNSHKRLLSVMQLVDGLGDDSDIVTCLNCTIKICTVISWRKLNSKRGAIH